jgi:hypothetical protein
MQISKAQILLLSTMTLIALISRWVPHPPNLTAVGALALMAGGLAGGRYWAPLLPLTVLFVSDLVLGFHSTMMWVYAGFVIVALMGMVAGPQKSWTRAGASIGLTSLIFFVVSNFGVWLTGGMYPMTAAGLAECFAMALPILGNQLAGDAIFGITFVLAARLTARWVQAALPAEKAQPVLRA